MTQTTLYPHTEARSVGIPAIRPPFTLHLLHTNEGVPGRFTTWRKETVENFYQLLFPEQGSGQGPARSVIFIKAPPYSGKTGLGQLLTLRLREIQTCSVVFLSAQELDPANEKVQHLFERMAKISLKDFLDRTEQRVIIVDGAQCTYFDQNFWNVTIKLALSGNRYPQLRIVLLSSFGSFNPFRDSARAGIPIEIPADNVFGLSSSPGLNLQFREFQEMVEGTRFEQFLDIIWVLCSNHIGIATSILAYLERTSLSWGWRTLTLDQVRNILYSNDILKSLSRERGMPHFDSFSKIVRAQNFSQEQVVKMKSTLQRVAMGEMFGLGSPGSNDAVETLLKHGFLFENQDRTLSFASQMHLKVWLYSTREDCVESFAQISFHDFIAMAIGRMHTAFLKKCLEQNSGDRVRERQIQMELYAAIVSLCPNTVYVTPEWRTSDKKGFVGIVVQYQNSANQRIMWFLELLVDGVGAKEHSERFEIGGKYRTSLDANSQFALIDFRQNVGVRDFKDDFVYVSFSNSFERATLKIAATSQIISLLA